MTHQSAQRLTAPDPLETRDSANTQLIRALLPEAYRRKSLSRGPVWSSDSRGTTILLGQTRRETRVSRRKGSSQALTAEAAKPAKSRLKWISGGVLLTHSKMLAAVVPHTCDELQVRADVSPQA